jgi:hypothetical protein
MLEFTLLAWDSENYNIMTWILAGNVDRVLRACWSAISAANGRTSWLYYAALDVGVNTINGNLLLRGPLVLAWQVDYIVGKVQRDLIQRKIRVLDLLGEHDIAVAIVALKRSG